MAEQNTNTETPAQQTDPAGSQRQGTGAAPNYDEIFQKLDAILDKRSDGLAKSALKDNTQAFGLQIDDGEISDIVKAYREQKEAKATEQATALSDAQKQIADLRKQIADRAIDDAFSAAALELGVDAKQLPYVARLASRDNILGSDGVPDAEKVKAAINKVLEDVPALKSTASANAGFVPVGAKGGNADTNADMDARLRRAFGLK